MKEAVRLRIAKKITNVSKTNSILFLSEKKKRNKKEKKKYRCENTASARKNFDFGQWKETTRALISPVTREREREGG